jgi:regulatory protein
MLAPAMRSSLRKLETEEELYAAALRALMRRAHSIHQMRDYLTRRADDTELVTSVVAKLRERAYLDDARYALDYARAHAQSRRQGRFRIARELRSRGVPDRYIEAAIDAVFAETDESGLIRARLKRRLAHLHGPLDRRKIASLYAGLLRAGFSSDVIRSEIRAATRASISDSAEIPPPED